MSRRTRADLSEWVISFTMKASDTEPRRFSLTIPAADHADAVHGAHQLAMAVNEGSGHVWKMTDDVSASPATPFYEVGVTYGDPDFPWKFRCDVVTTNPRSGERTALGWRFHRGEWEPYAYDEGDWDLHGFVDGRATGGR